MIEAKIVCVADTDGRCIQTRSARSPHGTREQAEPGHDTPKPSRSEVCRRELVDVADAAAVAMPETVTAEQEHGGRSTNQQRVTRFRASAGVEESLPRRGCRRICWLPSRCCTIRVGAAEHAAALTQRVKRMRSWFNDEEARRGSSPSARSHCCQHTVRPAFFAR